MSYFDQVCQQWQCEADGQLAQDVQQEEYDEKKDYNIKTRRTVRGDITVARRVHQDLKEQTSRERRDSGSTDFSEQELTKLKDVVYIEQDPEILELSNLDSGGYTSVELANIFRQSRRFDFDDDDDDEDNKEEEYDDDSISQPAIYQTRLPEPIRRVENVQHVRSAPKPERSQEYDFESLQRLIKGDESDQRHDETQDAILARELQDEELAKLLQAEEERKAHHRRIVKKDETVAKSFDEVQYKPRPNIAVSSSGSSNPNKVRKTKRTCILVYKGISGEEALAKYLQDVEKGKAGTGAPVEYTKIAVHNVTPGGNTKHKVTPGGPSRTIFHQKMVTNGNVASGASSNENVQNVSKERSKPPRPPLPAKTKVHTSAAYSAPRSTPVKTGGTLWYGGYANEGNYSWDKQSVSVNKPSLNGK